MKSSMEQRLPLMMIGGIFIALIIIINFSTKIVHRTPFEKLQFGLTKLMEEDFELVGEMSFKWKIEDAFTMDDMCLLYSGVINNASHTMMVDSFLTSDILNLNKKLGCIYTSQDQIIVKLDGQNNYLYYDVPRPNTIEYSTKDKLKKIINLLKDKVIDEGKEAVIIKSNAMDLKVMSNKLSVQLNNDDLIRLLEQIIPNRQSKLNNTLSQLFVNNDSQVVINIFIDHQHYINKIDMQFTNKDYSISSMHAFQNYNGAAHISIPDVSKEGVRINDMDKNEFLEKIGHVLLNPN